jgi:hypothetical protein
MPAPASPIKSVLPVLVLEMTYAGMEIAHSEAAGVAWEQMSPPQPMQTKRAHQGSLLGQDTFVMMRLLATLQA